MVTRDIDLNKWLLCLQDNPQPLPKPPNQELINHEKKRQIEAKLFSMGKKLRADGDKSEDEIKEIIAKERVKL